MLPITEKASLTVLCNWNILQINRLKRFWWEGWASREASAVRLTLTLTPEQLQPPTNCSQVTNMIQEECNQYLPFQALSYWFEGTSETVNVGKKGGEERGTEGRMSTLLYVCLIAFLPDSQFSWHPSLSSKCHLLLFHFILFFLWSLLIKVAAFLSPQTTVYLSVPVFVAASPSIGH